MFDGNCKEVEDREKSQPPLPAHQARRVKEKGSKGSKFPRGKLAPKSSRGETRPVTVGGGETYLEIRVSKNKIDARKNL